MADTTWPAILIPTAGGNPMPGFANTAGPSSASGQAQVIATDAGFWKLSMGGINVFTPKQWRAWNCTQVDLNGRVKNCLIPIYSKAWQPWPNFYGRKAKPKKKGANTAGALIYVLLDADLAQSGVVTTLRQKAGSTLEAGSHFSVAERLFIIQSITSFTRDGNDRVFDVVLWPPAREAVASGTRLEFDAPVFRAVLATDDEMSGLKPDTNGFATADVNWLEDN